MAQFLRISGFRVKNRSLACCVKRRIGSVRYSDSGGSAMRTDVERFGQKQPRSRLCRVLFPDR